MINRDIEQLRSVDPARRREAIVALGRSNDSAALSALADVYRNDPDPALRELALKAGRYLRQQTQDAQVAAPAAIPAASRPTDPLQDEVENYDEDESPTKPEPILRRRPVTDDEVARSKSFVDEALTHNINKNNAKALKALKLAVQANPNIVDDQFFRSVASTVTGVDGTGALALLVDQDQFRSQVKRSKQEKRQQEIDHHLVQARESKWSGVALEGVIFFILNAVAFVLLVLVIAEAFRAQARMEADDALMVEQMMQSAAILRPLETLQDESFLTLGLIGIIIAVGSVISMAVYGVILHFVAIAFQGHGTLPHLFDRLLGHYNRKLPLVYVILGAGYYVTFAFGVPFTALIIVYGFFRFLGVNRRSLKVVSEAYNFSFIMSIVASIFASFVVSFVLFAINFAISSLLLGVIL